jgi:hypothetical protein
MSASPRKPDPIEPGSRTIPLTRPSFDEAEERAVLAVLRSGCVTQGAVVADFERTLAERVGAAEAVAVTSGTTALFLGLHALGIGAGDEVIVPSLGFVASVNSILHAGATPVLVDVDPRTYCLDPSTLGGALSARTRAVMAVDQLGIPAEMDRIRAFADGFARSARISRRASRRPPRRNLMPRRRRRERMDRARTGRSRRRNRRSPRSLSPSPRRSRRFCPAARCRAKPGRPSG